MSGGLREQLQGVYDQHGKLTPDLVVDVAREPSHPLHHRFEWDDAVAGEAWRREQAHRLIQKVKVVYREADESGPARSIRAFHPIRKEDGHVFEPVEKVLQDPFMRQLRMRDMEREWTTLRRKYEEFEEFSEMVRRDLGDAA